MLLHQILWLHLSKANSLLSNRSQFTLRLSKALDVGELIIVIQAFLVRQRIRRLDRFARNNLLHRELDLLQVNGRLGRRKKD